MQIATRCELQCLNMNLRQIELFECVPILRMKPDHATFSMLLHSATADPEGRLLDRLPDVLGAMKAQMQQPSATVSHAVANADLDLA